jgi:hypothetical protein
VVLVMVAPGLFVAPPALLLETLRPWQ